MSKWDEKLMLLAISVSSFSKDPDHRVGAVIADSENRVISIGYNGPPKYIKDEGLSDEVRQLRTVHAELNAIFNSNASLKNSTIYVYPFMPCAQCAAAIIQKDIARVVYHKESNLKKWRVSQDEALRMFTEAGVFVESS